jgi:hypothetical protein
MALPSNPQTLANYDITKSDQAKIFVKKVSDLFLAIVTASGLSSILNGAGLLLGTALGAATVLNTNLLIKSVDLGTVTTNQTVDCVGATSVAVRLTISTAVNINLTLTHLALGVPVMINFNNLGGAPQTFGVLATQPGGTAYTAVFWKTSTALTNMTSIGLSVASGGSIISSGAAVPTSNWDLMMVAN